MRTSLFVLSCVLLWPRLAAASPVVSWEAPQECPQADAGRAEVARLLGKSLTAIEVALTAAVHIERRAASEFVAVIAIRSGGRAHERVLHDAACAALAQAAALVIALALDPGARWAAPGIASEARAGRDPPAPDASSAAERAESSAAPESARPPPPRAAEPRLPAAVPETLAPPDSTRAESQTDVREAAAPTVRAIEQTPHTGGARRGRGLGWFASGAGALSFGVLPGAAPSFAAALGLLAGPWRAAVRLSYAPERRAALPDAPSVGGRVALAAGAVELGFRLRFDGLEVPLLAGLETGWFRAHGDGVGAPRTQHPLWFAPFLASGVTYAWRTRWAIGLRLEGARALRRPHFAVENESGVAYDFHRPARIVGRGVLEFELRFP